MLLCVNVRAAEASHLPAPFIHRRHWGDAPQTVIGSIQLGSLFLTEFTSFDTG
jgi:hypothetical protein